MMDRVKSSFLDTHRSLLPICHKFIYVGVLLLLFFLFFFLSLTLFNAKVTRIIISWQEQSVFGYFG